MLLHQFVFRRPVLLLSLGIVFYSSFFWGGDAKTMALMKKKILNLERKMKKLLPLLILFSMQLSNLKSQNSIDIYLEGVSDCMGEENFKILSDLFVEIDSRLLETVINSDNPYFDFSLKFCNNEISSNFFTVQPASKLDSLIKKTLALEYWYIEKVDFDEPIIIDGKDVEIIPPGGEVPRPDPDSIEKIVLNPEKKFIACSKLYTLNKTISTYYNLYDQLGVASSKVKLCGLYEIIGRENFKSNAVKYFIGIDVILQRMLHQNSYENFVTD